MEGELSIREGLFGFYIFGTTWVHRCVLCLLSQAYDAVGWPVSCSMTLLMCASDNNRPCIRTHRLQPALSGDGSLGSHGSVPRATRGTHIAFFSGIRPAGRVSQCVHVDSGDHFRNNCSGSRFSFLVWPAIAHRYHEQCIRSGVCIAHRGTRRVPTLPLCIVCCSPVSNCYPPPQRRSYLSDRAPSARALCRRFALVLDRNPRASVFGSVSGASRRPSINAHGWCVIGEVTGVRPVTNGRFMDEQGTMQQCSRPHCFEITYTRGNKSCKHILSAPDAASADRWLEALSAALQAAHQSTHVQPAPVHPVYSHTAASAAPIGYPPRAAAPPFGTQYTQSDQPPPYTDVVGKH